MVHKATRKQIGLIKSLQKKTGLSDDDYRDFLATTTGKRRAKDLTMEQAGAVIEALQGGKKRYRKTSSSPMVRRIFVMWRLMAEANVVNKDGLRAYVKRMAGVDDPEWLNDDQASTIIEALKAWAFREGVYLGRQ